MEKIELLVFYKWRKIYFPSFLLLLYTHRLEAQYTSFAASARAMSMGGAAVTNHDYFAWKNNPAGAALLAKVGASANFYSRYGMQSMNTASLQVSVPIKKIVSGLSFQKYGDQFYSEQQAGLGVASKIGIVALGTQVHALQFRMDEMPSKYAWVGEFGGIADLGKHLSWGAHIWNFNLAKLRTTYKVELPIIMRTGISYKPNRKLMGNLEISKHIQYQSSIHAGLEYRVVEWLAIRTGVSSKPFIACFGAGVQHKKIIIDYAFTSHQQLGLSHQLSLAVLVHSKAKEDGNVP